MIQQEQSEIYRNKNYVRVPHLVGYGDDSGWAKYWSASSAAGCATSCTAPKFCGILLCWLRCISALSPGKVRRTRSLQKQSLFFMKKRCCSPARLFFNPSIRTFGILFFFSRRPPRTLLPDTTPKIQWLFLYWKIVHFIKENLPTIAFHQEFNENHRKSARDG